MNAYFIFYNTYMGPWGVNGWEKTEFKNLLTRYISDEAELTGA
jgi:hypothetical protein